MNPLHKAPDIFIRNSKRFWLWFQENEKTFFDAVKSHDKIETVFFDSLAQKLAEVKEGILFLAGMADDNTAELIFTADGIVRNFVFIEDLVELAPELNGWKFSALKPSMKEGNIGIQLGGYLFNHENMSFYANDHPDYPDKIDISIVHHELTSANSKEINMGVFIFLDNYLGEQNFAENIDNLRIISPREVEKELLPLFKLNEYLKWRQKEFIEKFEDVLYDTIHDKHTLYEAETESGNKLLAILNSRLLAWNNKASHPWIVVTTIHYDGRNHNGLPSEKDYDRLDKIEESIGNRLSDKDGCLYIGRQIGENAHEMYHACKDYRIPSRVITEIQDRFSSEFQINFNIYKDKYWKTFQHLQ